MDELSLTLSKGKSIFFASDFHLGVANTEMREKKIVSWLTSIEKKASAIFLVGDVFDFWFEYKHVVPKGYIRFLGKLAQLRDSGIPIYFFHGNHDMWMFDYLEKELDIPIFKDEIKLNIDKTTIRIGHGDGLGPGDNFYKFLKIIFKHRLAHWLFRWIHPNGGFGLAKSWSAESKGQSEKNPDEFRNEGEWLWSYCKTLEKQTHHDYYIYGHRHLPLELPVGDNSTYINLGEWMDQCTYGEFDGKSFHLKKFEG